MFVFSRAKESAFRVKTCRRPGGAIPIDDQNAHLYQSIGDTIVLLFRSFERGLVVAADSFGNVGEFQKGFLKETKAWLT